MTETKPCVQCGKPISRINDKGQYRKDHTWKAVRYCNHKCRQRFLRENPDYRAERPDPRTQRTRIIEGKNSYLDKYIQSAF